ADNYCINLHNNSIHPPIARIIQTHSTGQQHLGCPVISPRGFRLQLSNPMNKPSYPFGQIIFRFLSIVSIVSVLASCQLLPSAQTETPVSAPLSETMPTQESIPPVWPGTFQTPLLNPLDKPHTYNNETCRYLRNKWNPSNAEPGTVVMVLLIKNINRGT